MGLLSWLTRRKDGPPDFETILNELDDSIRNREQKLAIIKHREHRGVVLFTVYTFGAWALYGGLYWLGAVEWLWHQLRRGNSIAEPDVEQEGNAELLSGALQLLPILAVPILYIFTRRIVKWYYGRKQRREVKELTALRKRQKEQVDALKKLSNYDKITEMLERHGQNTPRSSPSGASRTPARANGAQAGGNLATPANANGQGQAFVTSPTPAQQLQAMQRGLNPPTTAQGKKVMQPHMVGDSRMGTPIRNPGQAGMPQTPTLVAPPTQPRGLIDKLADALLGDNEQSPNSKYALVCQQCFSHNGLALREEFMDIQFVCPRCGFFNPSRRSKASGVSTTSLGRGDDVLGSARSAPSRTSLPRPLPNKRSSGRSSPLSQTQDVFDDSQDDSLISPSLRSEISDDGHLVPNTDTDHPSRSRSVDEADSLELETAPMNADERKRDLRQRTTAAARSSDMQIDDE